MADRKKLTDKQAADALASYQRGEALPDGTIIDFTEAPYVFHAGSVATVPVTIEPTPADMTPPVVAVKSGK
jgi:hypothetical protein